MKNPNYARRNFEFCANSAQAYFTHISGLSLFRKLVSKIIWLNGSWIGEKLREINKMKKFITVITLQLTSSMSEMHKICQNMRNSAHNG